MGNVNAFESILRDFAFSVQYIITLNVRECACLFLLSSLSASPAVSCSLTLHSPSFPVSPSTSPPMGCGCWAGGAGGQCDGLAVWCRVRSGRTSRGEDDRS